MACDRDRFAHTLFWISMGMLGGLIANELHLAKSVDTIYLIVCAGQVIIYVYKLCTVKKETFRVLTDINEREKVEAVLKELKINAASIEWYGKFYFTAKMTRAEAISLFDLEIVKSIQIDRANDKAHQC